MDKMLGKRVMDIVTGFKGVCTGKAEYLYGCTQYCIVPEVNEKGEVGTTQWFDEGRIKKINTKVKPEQVRGKKPGGPQRDAPA